MTIENHYFTVKVKLSTCTAAFAVIMMALLGACNSDDFNEGPFISKRKAILAFSFDEFQPPVVGEIDYVDSTVHLVVPFGTDLTSLVPSIEVSDKASISPASGVANDFSDTVVYVVTAENGTTQDWQIIVQEGEEEAKLRLKLSAPIWNRSPTGTGVPDFFTKDGNRGLAYGNDHLYITNNNDQILIINPNDGTVIDPLDMTGVSGGEPKISDVAVSGKYILACNTVEWTSDAGGEPTTFKIYKWNSETAQPDIYLSYTNTEYRMGDSFSVIGDIDNDAVILTAFGRKFLNPTSRGNLVFKWTVTGGVLNPEPDMITISGVPSLTKLGSRPHAQMLSPDSEELYVNANDIEITKTDLNGAFISRLPNTGRQLYDGFSSYFDLFEFLGKRVIVTPFPRSSIESRLIVMDLSEGLENVTTEDVILSSNFMEGAGEIANINASGAVTYHQVDANNVAVYVLITNQALVKFNLTAEFN